MEQKTPLIFEQNTFFCLLSALYARNVDFLGFI